MMYRIDLSAFSQAEYVKIQKDLQPYVWETYNVSYNPPVIDVHWTLEKSIKEIFPNLCPYLTAQ